jgi:phosphatidylglycerophosphate synthase
MNVPNTVIDACRNFVRRIMASVAKALNALTGGLLSPNMVTFTGLIAHGVIAYLIATGRPIWSAGLLVIFGLFDTLDGELARLQKSASDRGMLLDASTDRMKEVLLYTGAAYFFVSLENPYYAVWAVAACGASILVSYVKAKGETAVRGAGLSPNEVNRLFQDGLARFEVRMFILIVGLLGGFLAESLVVITVLSSLTAVSRLYKISRKL